MAKAIFTADFNYSSRNTNAGWAIKASPDPQSFPSEVVEAAIAASVAKPVPAKKSTQKSRD